MRANARRKQTPRSQRYVKSNVKSPKTTTAFTRRLVFFVLVVLVLTLKSYRYMFSENVMGTTTSWGFEVVNRASASSNVSSTTTFQSSRSVGITPETQRLGLPADSNLTPPRNKTSERERERIMNVTIRPPLATFLGPDGKSTPEARFLLDYVVAGFAKCGTTTLGEWLAMHPQVKSQHGEVYHVGMKPGNSIKKLHKLLPKNGTNNQIMVLKKGSC
jgi:hypothetical protein